MFAAITIGNEKRPTPGNEPNTGYNLMFRKSLHTPSSSKVQHVLNMGNAGTAGLEFFHNLMMATIK